MTELEMLRAKRAYDKQTRKNWWERLTAWWRVLVHDDRVARRERLDRKAEVERKARQSL